MSSGAPSPVESGLEDQPWWHNVTLERAARVKLLEGRPAGTFCVRPSSVGPHHYSIDVALAAGPLKCLVQPVPGTGSPPTQVQLAPIPSLNLPEPGAGFATLVALVAATDWLTDALPRDAVPLTDTGGAALPAPTKGVAEGGDEAGWLQHSTGPAGGAAAGSSTFVAPPVTRGIAEGGDDAGMLMLSGGAAPGGHSYDPMDVPVAMKGIAGSDGAGKNFEGEWEGGMLMHDGGSGAGAGAALGIPGPR